MYLAADPDLLPMRDGVLETLLTDEDWDDAEKYLFVPWGFEEFGWGEVLGWYEERERRLCAAGRHREVITDEFLHIVQVPACLGIIVRLLLSGIHGAATVAWTIATTRSNLAARNFLFQRILLIGFGSADCRAWWGFLSRLHDAYSRYRGITQC